MFSKLTLRYNYFQNLYVLEMKQSQLIMKTNHFDYASYLRGIKDGPKFGVTLGVLIGVAIMIAVLSVIYFS